jgi:phosphotransferase system HPr-like phosphotransfer protein
MAASPAGPSFVLPANRLPEADERAEAGQKDSLPAARLVGRVIRTIEDWAPIHATTTDTDDERQAFMKELCSEATARDLESRVHNLQSEYDSTIRGSAEEKEQPALLKLRGAISQCLHLLEAVTALTHLYERHQVHQRHPATRRVLGHILNWENFLAKMIDHCLRPALASLEKSKDLAAGLLECLTTQAFKDLRIPHGITLHARPLSLIVGVTNHYGLPVEMEIGEGRASAASMMSMLMLCGSHLDAQSVRFHGDPAVLNDLQALFDARLGEDGMDALPGSLKYLVH